MSGIGSDVRTTIAGEEPLRPDEVEALLEASPLELGEAQVRPVGPAAAARRVHQLDQSPYHTSTTNPSAAPSEGSTEKKKKHARAGAELKSGGRDERQRGRGR